MRAPLSRPPKQGVRAGTLKRYRVWGDMGTGMKPVPTPFAGDAYLSHKLAKEVYSALKASGAFKRLVITQLED